MKLGELKPTRGAVKDTKRRGRGQGSGLGRTGGRGEKGYHARTGSGRDTRYEGGQMPLHRRLPKRGFSNAVFKKVYQIVNLDVIEKLNDTEINVNVLKTHGLVSSVKYPVKILAGGELTRKVNITANAFSAAAKEKIEKAGGTATVQC